MFFEFLFYVQIDDRCNYFKQIAFFLQIAYCPSSALNLYLINNVEDIVVFSCHNNRETIVEKNRFCDSGYFLYFLVYIIFNGATVNGSCHSKYNPVKSLLLLQSNSDFYIKVFFVLDRDTA